MRLKLRANVPAFSAKLTCEQGKLVDYNQTCPTGTCMSMEVILNITSPTCQLVPTSNPNFSMSGPSADGSKHGVLFSSNCSGTDSDPYRLAIFYGQWAGARYHKRHSPGEWKPVQSTAILCKVSHSLTTSDVQVDDSGELLAVKEGKTKSLVPGLSNAILGEAVLASIRSAALLGNHPRNQGDLSMSLDNFFDSMLAITQPRNASTALEDFAFLESGFQRLFSLLSVQIAKQYLQSNSTGGSSSLIGMTSTPEQRLFVRLLALRSMEGILAALLAVSVGLGVIAPRKKTPRDPASIGGLAVVLKSSHEVIDQLKGTGSWSMQEMRARLTDTYRSQSSNENFTVHASSTGYAHDPALETLNQTQEELTVSVHLKKFGPIQEQNPKLSGHPFLTKRVSRFFLIVTAIILMLIVETLYQQSQRKDGITNTPSSKTNQYSWTYIPALVMVAYQLFYSTIDFHVRVYGPYLRMTWGDATARASILDNALPKVSLHAMWSAFRRNDPAVALSALGLFVSTGLTIAVSGLYTSEAIAATSAINISALDSLSPPQLVSKLQSLDMETRLTTFLVQNNHLTDPLWTTGYLALPELALPNAAAASPPLQNITSLRVTVPAQRASLNCSVVPQNQITATRDSSYNSSFPNEPSQWEISWPMWKSWDCLVTGMSMTATGEQSYMYSLGTAGWFGSWYE
jgi:hypothetical protein